MATCRPGAPRSRRDIFIDTLEPETKKVLMPFKGLEGKAMAKCTMKKETRCEVNGKGGSLCKVKKFVQCDSVCKLKQWFPKKGIDCDAKICSKPYKNGQTYGQFVCARAAMMA